MANEQNLKPIISTKMARELQEKAVQKRRENTQKNKTFKAMLLLALDEINEETGKTKREEINEAIISKAINGDTKAFEIVRDTVGEKPIEKIEGKQEINITMQNELKQWGQ